MTGLLILASCAAGAFVGWYGWHSGLEAGWDEGFSAAGDNHKRIAPRVCAFSRTNPYRGRWPKR